MRRYRQPRGQYKNNLEQDIASFLEEAEGVVFDYESEKIEFIQPARMRHYLVDFRVTLPSGYTFYIETKGRLRVEDRQKYEWLRKSNPSLDLRFLFQKNNKITKHTHSPRYSDWADKNGFMWAIKNIPKEWLQ